MERSLLAGGLLLAVLGAVPKPENVRMNSVNLKNILEWELAPLPYENVTFTAQSMSYTGVFEDVCKNIVLRQCDFSHLAKYGDHTLRIWMETEGGHSDWVNVTFHPVEDTVIGPPNLQVKPVSSSLHVHFSFPKIENEPETWTLKDYYGSWEYKVLYWKRGTSQKLEMVTPFESDMLPDLDPRTTYCLQAQGLVPALNKSGLWSQPICETTADDGKTPVWVIAVMLLASLVAVLLVVLCSFSVLWYLYRQARYVFFPGYSLPKLLKECHPSHGTPFLSSPPSEKEPCDKLSVVLVESEGHRQHASVGSPRADRVPEEKPPVGPDGPEVTVSAPTEPSAEGS
ncbi:interleukin-10 receptor subunit beta [Ornithorhynchus anatinus]|uniref:interleukin-10 receptor subunit beta n=1 Tax=Ornithorhynchus anatinus TaxID=9258 RepID=UPI0010A76464|nr:interleukin-10 receptor subunit beta [Ornithorhynchus anatinus]